MTIRLSDLCCLWKVEDGGAKIGVNLAGGNSEVAGAAAKINDVMKTRQVERLDNLWRTEQAEAVHAVQENFFGFRRAEKLIEDGSIGAKHLLPPWRALANGVFEAVPEPEQDVV